MAWIGRFASAVLWFISKWGAIALIGESTWFFFRSLMNGLSFEQALVMGMAGLGAGLLFLVGVARTLDYLASRTKEALDGWRVAQHLSEALDAGHREKGIIEIVNIWLEVQPDNATLRALKKNSRLRTLKDAVSQGLLKANLGHNSFPDMNSPVDVRSAIEFFKKRRWYQVKPRQSGEVYGDER